MSKIKNYIDALNAVRTLIVTDSVSDNDIEMYANVIYLKIMEHDSPELAASYIIRNLFKEHKAETTRIACNYQVEHSTMMADRYAYLIRCIRQKIEKMTIPIDEDTVNYMQSLQPHHEEKWVALLPVDRNENKKAVMVFKKAIESGLISVSEDKLHFNGSNALLSYLCGIVYCDDTKYQDPVTKEWLVKLGSTFFPESELNNLFDVINLGSSRLQLKYKRLPKGHEKVDKLF